MAAHLDVTVVMVRTGTMLTDLSRTCRPRRYLTCSLEGEAVNSQQTVNHAYIVELQFNTLNTNNYLDDFIDYILIL